MNINNLTINKKMGGGNMLAKRRRFMNSKPYDAEIEYLESDGNQYIDTLIETNNELSIDVTFLCKGLSPNFEHSSVTACREDAGTNSRDQISFTVYRRDGSNLHYGWGLDEYIYITDRNYLINKKTSISIDKNNFKVNGEVKTTNQNNTKVTSLGNTLYLFGRNTGNKLVNAFIGNIYKATYKLNGETILDLMPVRKGNEGFMYDKVSKRLLGNSGSGKFILGPDKPYDAEVEYLETVEVEGKGISTIALDYIPQQIQDIDLYLDFMLKGWASNTSDYRLLCGAYNESNYSTDYLIQRYLNSNNRLTINWGTKGGSDVISTTLNKRSNIEIQGNNRKVILDGVVTTLKDFNTGKTPNTARFPVFSGNKTQPSGALWRLYSMKIIQEGEVLYDLIPVRKDGKGYLYNKITGQLYGVIEGYPDIVIGPDVN